MGSVNKAIIVGNLGQDPQVKHLDNGASVASFSVATSETWKDGNGKKQERTEWHNVTLWRGLAEIAEKYLKKGDSVYIEGKLQTESYEKDGVTRYTTKIVGSQMTMLGSSKSNSDVQGAQERKQPPSVPNTDAREGELPPATEEDDLPF